jgi:hypothetical protein
MNSRYPAWLWGIIVAASVVAGIAWHGIILPALFIAWLVGRWRKHHACGSTSKPGIGKGRNGHSKGNQGLSLANAQGFTVDFLCVRSPRGTALGSALLAGIPAHCTCFARGAACASTTDRTRYAATA